MRFYSSLIALVALGACQAEELPVVEEPRAVVSFDAIAPRNVFVVSFDTMAVSRLRNYGALDTSMPFLDGMLDEAITLKGHQSCSNWTFASVLCAQTGLDAVDLQFVPSASGMLNNLAPSGMMGFPDYHPRDPWALLTTGNTWFSHDVNSSVGFDAEVLFSLDAKDEDRAEVHALNLYEEGVSRVESHNSNPWYYHLHLMDLHAPYNPPDDYLVGIEKLPAISYDLSTRMGHYEPVTAWIGLPKGEQDDILQHFNFRYDAEMRYLDDQLAEIFADMGNRGLLDDTLVVFWSDHGEAFYEHSYQSHALTLYGEETDAMAAFWVKGGQPSAYTEPTTHEDILPTLLNAYGVAIPDGLSGVVVGEALDDRVLTKVTDGKLGVILSVEQFGVRLQHKPFAWDRMYDLTVDPDEQTDIYEEGGDMAETLHAIVSSEYEKITTLIDNDHGIDEEMPFPDN